jgi:predicted ester cyclase
MSKDTALRLYELLNAGQAEQVGDLVTPNYIENDPLPGQGTGREGIIDRFSMLVGALAPHFTIEDVIAEGDRVVVRWKNSCTHVGEFAGIPASGLTFGATGIDIYRVEGDKLAEHWHVVDQLPMFAALGLLTPA